MRARRTAAGAALTALALTSVLAGCDGSSDDRSDKDATSTTASPDPTATTSPTSSATPVAQQAPRSPKTGTTNAGRQAFARFVMDSWSYAVRTNDARAVSRLSPRSKPCQGCRDLTKALAKRKKQGWYVDFPGLALRRQKTTKLDPLTYVVRSTVDIPQSQSLNDDGSFRNVSRGHRGAVFEVAMTPSGKGYRLLAFSVS